MLGADVYMGTSSDVGESVANVATLGLSPHLLQHKQAAVGGAVEQDIDLGHWRRGRMNGSVKHREKQFLGVGH